MLHQAKGDRGYQALKEDVAVAKSDPAVEAITTFANFAHTFPLSTSVVFYKGGYGPTTSAYIHELDAGCGCMHMWSE